MQKEITLLPPIARRQADAGRGGQTEAEKQRMFCTDTAMGLSGEQERLSLFQNKQMTSDTEENRAVPQEDIQRYCQESCMFPRLEQRSFTPSLDEGCEEKLFSGIGLLARQEKSPWGPSYYLFGLFSLLGPLAFPDESIRVPLEEG